MCIDFFLKPFHLVIAVYARKTVYKTTKKKKNSKYFPRRKEPVNF